MGKGRIGSSHGSATAQIHPNQEERCWSAPQISWHTCRPSLVGRGGTAGAPGPSASRRQQEAGSGQGLVVGSSRDPSLLLASGLSPVLHPSPCASCHAVAGGAQTGLLGGPIQATSNLMLLLLSFFCCYHHNSAFYGIIWAN